MPHCVVGLFLISPGSALQRHPSPCSMTDCCNYSRALSDGNCAPAAHKFVLGFRSEITPRFSYTVVMHSVKLIMVMTLLMIMKLEKKESKR